MPKTDPRIPRTYGVALSETARAELRRRIEIQGESRVRATLDVASETLARALAGLPLNRTIARMLERDCGAAPSL